MREPSFAYEPVLLSALEAVLSHTSIDDYFYTQAAIAITQLGDTRLDSARDNVLRSRDRHLTYCYTVYQERRSYDPAIAMMNLAASLMMNELGTLNEEITICIDVYRTCDGHSFHTNGGYSGSGGGQSNGGNSGGGGGGGGANDPPVWPPTRPSTSAGSNTSWGNEEGNTDPYATLYWMSMDSWLDLDRDMIECINGLSSDDFATIMALRLAAEAAGSNIVSCGGQTAEDQLKEITQRALATDCSYGVGDRIREELDREEHIRNLVNPEICPCIANILSVLQNDDLCTDFGVDSYIGSSGYDLIITSELSPDNILSLDMGMTGTLIDASIVAITGWSQSTGDPIITINPRYFCPGENNPYPPVDPSYVIGNHELLASMIHEFRHAIYYELYAAVDGNPIAGEPAIINFGSWLRNKFAGVAPDDCNLSNQHAEMILSTINEYAEELMAIHNEYYARPENGNLAPLSVDNFMYAAGVGLLTVQPGNQWSACAELIYGVERLEAWRTKHNALPNDGLGLSCL